MRTRHVIAAAIGLVALIWPGAAWTQAAPPQARIPDAIPRDTGAGELLRVVVGGVYPDRAAAAEAVDATPFGDLQGFYVVPVAQFQGMRDELGAPGDFALVSAFRTKEGALGFVELADSFGVDAVLLGRPVRSLGGLYAGLGQEPAPDGSGPLLGPIPPTP